MNSFNHYAFGAAGDWMYRYLAGLNSVEPGYRRTELRPRPGGGFTQAHATHESLYGTHACGWRIENGTLHVDVSVPPNTSATLVLPLTNGGPGYHTEVPALRIYKEAFLSHRFGSAAAMSVLFGLILIGLSVLQIWIARRFTVSESD